MSAQTVCLARPRVSMHLLALTGRHNRCPMSLVSAFSKQCSPSVNCIATAVEGLLVSFTLLVLSMHGVVFPEQHCSLGNVCS